MIAVMSIGVALWCIHLAPPELSPAREGNAFLPQTPSRSPALARVTPASMNGDQACDFGEAILIAAPSDPARRVVSVMLPDGKVVMRRPGEALAGYRLEKVELARAVFDKNGRRCALHIGPRDGGGDAPLDEPARRRAPTWVASSAATNSPLTL